MKGVILLFVIQFQITIQCLGQYDALLRSDIDSLLLEVKSLNGQLQINWKELNPQPASARKEFIEVLNVDLQDADLIILYKLPTPDKQLYYKVKVNLQTIDQDSISPSSERVLQDYGIVEEDFKNEKRIIWTDLTEDVLYYGGSYRAYITAELWGEVDCEASRPVFGVNEQWPHYLTAGVGITLLGAGQFYRQQQKQAYQDYEQLWLKGRSGEEAKLPYQNAVDYHKSSKVLTYTGWGLLGANLVWSTLRLVKVKKKQKLYDQYCTKSTNTGLGKISPILQPFSNSVGVKLSW